MPRERQRRQQIEDDTLGNRGDILEHADILSILQAARVTLMDWRASAITIIVTIGNLLRLKSVTSLTLSSRSNSMVNRLKSMIFADSWQKKVSLMLKQSESNTPTNVSEMLFN